MRELKNNELVDVCGASWWSPSNILGFLHGIGHTPEVSTPGFVPNLPTPPSGHIGNAIGMTVVAGIVAVAALLGAASTGIAGFFGAAALIKFK